jgi:hypothetical protein
MRDEYARNGKIMITNTNKISMPDSRGIPGRQEEGNFKQRIDNFCATDPLLALMLQFLVTCIVALNLPPK